MKKSLHLLSILFLSSSLLAPTRNVSPTEDRSPGYSDAEAPVKPLLEDQARAFFESILARKQPRAKGFSQDTLNAAQRGAVMLAEERGRTRTNLDQAAEFARIAAAEKAAYRQILDRAMERLDLEQDEHQARQSLEANQKEQWRKFKERFEQDRERLMLESAIFEESNPSRRNKLQVVYFLKYGPKTKPARAQSAPPRRTRVEAHSSPRYRARPSTPRVA